MFEVAQFLRHFLCSFRFNALTHKPMPFFRTPALLRRAFPSCYWQIPKPLHEQPTLYLTFDDGPVPEATPDVLGVLDRYGVKASFFCVGDNVRKHPALFREVLHAGHTVGNHTFHHVKGWQTSLTHYLKEVSMCRHVMEDTAGAALPRLFRPPYGRITPKQLCALRKDYAIIMWDILTHDYDPRLQADALIPQLKPLLRHGSILVFHDSIKAYPRMIRLLPAIIEAALARGFSFATLEEGLAPTLHALAPTASYKSSS
jgi:peptidoglycan/xylan/chitin deacetylase (PgdA/CDA1 family)